MLPGDDLKKAPSDLEIHTPKFAACRKRAVNLPHDDRNFRRKHQGYSKFEDYLGALNFPSPPPLGSVPAHGRNSIFFVDD